MLDRLLLRPREAGELTGLGRSFVYDLIRRGVLPSVRIGRTVRVPADALRIWIEQLPRSGPTLSDTALSVDAPISPDA